MYVGGIDDSETPGKETLILSVGPCGFTFALPHRKVVLVSVALGALMVSFGASAHPGGHGTEGFHRHEVDGTEILCQTTEDCHDRMEEIWTSTPGSLGGCEEGFHKTVTSGPFKYYNSHWWLKTQGQCLDNGVPLGTHYSIVWDWYLFEMPPACNNGEEAPACPQEGQQFALEVPEPPPPEGCMDNVSSVDESNPCNPATGNKSQVEVDYSPSAVGGLRFARYYNSKGGYNTAAHSATGWRHTYSRSIDEAPDRKPNVLWTKPENQSAFYATASEACTTGWSDIKDTAWNGSLSTGTATFAGGNVCKIAVEGSTIAHFPVRSGIPWGGYSVPSNTKIITRPNGAAHTFELIGSTWTNELDPSVTLEQSGGNWIFTDTQDSRETYNSAGQLVSITYRNGQTESLAYDLTVAQGGDDDSETLDKVIGPFGHALSFTYVNGMLDSVTTPDGAIEYTYDADDNLIAATFPDATDRGYVYEEDNFPNHLTGIIDENDDRFATWDYDENGWAILSEHAGGKERVQFAYHADGSTTVTTGGGASRTYTFTTAQGQRRLESVTGDICSTCSQGNIKSREYDNNGFLSEVTDWNDNVTQMTRNGRGLIETLVEAHGSTEERTTATTWHSTYRIPTQVASPKNVTDYTHDANGNILTATISGGGKSRVWTFTYNANGQPLTVDGPRTDVSDVTALEYYTCSTGGECGQLKKVTNALGHVTNYDSYDTAGRLTQMTDPNGLQTSYAYDLRGRLLTVTETPTAGAARVTSMTYDDAGQLQTYTLPNGTVLTYTYSDAHYLTSVTDNLGNSISYDYDAMGNLTDEDTKDPQNALKQSMDYVVDQNYRLESLTHGPVSTDLTYDLVGNLTQETDGNNAQTQYVYDALNRLDTTTDALSGVTDYGYDDHDNITQVIAPNGATTGFAYDQLDNLLSETSPDRGTVTYTYDDAGNRLTQTDARNITGTYAYDALNRPISINYPNTAENVTFAYDHAGSEGLGRLRSISDQVGTITLSYNEFGEVTVDQRQIGSFTYTTSYQYDAAGNVSQIVYPSGRVADYTRNALGQVTAIASTKNGTQKTIVSNATYEPFGPLSGITYGNARTFSYDHRADYRVDSFSAGAIVDKTYDYDVAGNISKIIDNVESDKTQQFGYDALDRLISEDVIADYFAIVTADSPLVYWQLDEASHPTAFDSSGNGYDGPFWYSPNFGHPALVTSGDSALGETGGVVGPWLSGVGITGVEFWFQTTSVTEHRYLYQLYRSNWDYFLVTHRTDGTITVEVDQATVLSSDGVVSTNEPHHVAVWYDAGTNATYLMVDGVTQTSTHAGNAFDVFDPRSSIAVIQWNNNVYYRVTGILDEVALYDTSVTASTFADRYTLGSLGGRSDTITYDANGNRETLDDGSSVTSYGFQASSNQLISLDGSAIQRDASGNRTADVGGTRTYTYNDQNRLSAVLDSGATTASYVHNALGQRSRKTIGGAEVVYLYDLDGNLLAEHDATGTLIRDYVWMNGAPVAQIDQGEEFSYLHFDHLNTPRLATDDNQTIVWRWDSDAFGTTLPDEDPDGDGNGTTVNLRFPGQYFDQETGFHYNYFRTYDPSTGRYVESDPIGLVAGLNTYSYVGSMPTTYVDPFGLEVTGTYDLNTGVLTITDSDMGRSMSIPAESGGKPFGDPLPKGQYEILDQARNPESFRLDPLDRMPRNDRHEPSGRDLFRLHEPGLTVGCIAAENRDEWGPLRDLINSTNTTTVQDKARPWWKFWAKDEPIKRFGTLEVK